MQPREFNKWVVSLLIIHFRLPRKTINPPNYKKGCDFRKNLIPCQCDFIYVVENYACISCFYSLAIKII